MVPEDGAGVLGQSGFGARTGVGSKQGAEPRSAEGMGLVRLSTTKERDEITSRSVSSLSTSALTTLELPARKLFAREPKRERLELTIINKLAMVLNVAPCSLLKRRRARLM